MAGFGADRPIRRRSTNAEDCPFSAINRCNPIGHHRVEWGSGAAAVGRACLFPPLSSGGALYKSLARNGSRQIEALRSQLVICAKAGMQRSQGPAADYLDRLLPLG